MKRFALLFTLVLTLSVIPAMAARHHTHPTHHVAHSSSTAEPIEVYSDTTTNDSVDSAATSVQSVTNNVDDDSISYVGLIHDFLRYNSFTSGWVPLFAIFMFFLFILAPFVIIFVIIWYLIKRHNDRVRLASLAIQQGQPIPEPLRTNIEKSNTHYKNKGILNIAIGIGLVIMFEFWDSSTLQGVGALVACIGLGQVIIAKTTRK